MRKSGADNPHPQGVRKLGSKCMTARELRGFLRARDAIADDDYDCERDEGGCMRSGFVRHSQIVRAR